MRNDFRDEEVLENTTLRLMQLLVLTLRIISKGERADLDPSNHVPSYA